MAKYIVGNWKMHLGPSQASLLLHHLNQKIPKASPKAKVVLCPPFISLYTASKEMDKQKFRLGSQDAYYIDEGPYTGQISAAMLKGLVDYAIIGHSEMRRYANEDDKTIAAKLPAVLRNGIKPILCVGESLVDRHHGLSTKVVVDQITADLSMLVADDLKDVLIAYEPVWAIGTGDFASPDDVAPAVRAIRQTAEDLFGEGRGSDIGVLYGGSVVPDNSRAYLEMTGVDGLLVGGASLNYEDFSSIVKVAQNL